MSHHTRGGKGDPYPGTGKAGPERWAQPRPRALPVGGSCELAQLLSLHPGCGKRAGRGGRSGWVRVRVACGAWHKPRFPASSLLALRSDVGGEDGDAGGPALPTPPHPPLPQVTFSQTESETCSWGQDASAHVLGAPRSVSATQGASLLCSKPGKDAPTAKALTSVLAPLPESLINPNLPSRILVPLFLSYTQGY